VTFVETQFVTLFDSASPLKLESGQSLPSVTLAYETYGKLNNKKSNAILICHALSGDAHAAFKHKGKEKSDGWWDNMVGPGKAIDTDRFFVICSNTIGSCLGSTGPSSIDPKTKKPYGLNFPIITISDMTQAQKALIYHLGISKLKAVIGGSMGGMQALEWAINYPEMAAQTIAIATTSKISPQALAFGAVGRKAISSDVKWKKGNYYGKDIPEDGLSIARMIGHITYLSEESMSRKFGRRLQAKSEYGYNFQNDFQIESYLQYQGDKFVNRFDANAYLYLSKAMSYFDLGKKYGSLKKAFKPALSQFLIISISSDWLYPSAQSKEVAKVLMNLDKQVSFSEVQSPYGHDGFLLETDAITQLIRPFLGKK
jgi:homoserine O-acetyltransferase